VDGITGVGKTYLTQRAVEGFEQQPMLLGGFSRRTGTDPGLGRNLLRALIDASAGDPFLRGGSPLAETMLLLAIKRHDLDIVLPVLSTGRAVVEGRGVDTTAVCQAVQLHPHNADAAFAFLQSRGILVRKMAGYGLPAHLRITIGTGEEMERVAAALTEFMGRNE